MSDAGSRSVRVGWCVSCCCLWVAHVLIVVKGVLTSHMASSPLAQSPEILDFSPRSLALAVGAA